MSERLQVRILGSGTSTGVPTIGCPCDVCKSPDPRNQRLRSSILLRHGDESLVIDTTPDFRQQALDAGLTRLGHVLYTHPHADHCHGFDDLRAFFFHTRQPIRGFLWAGHEEEFRVRFAYAFRQDDYPGVKPEVTLTAVTPGTPFEAAGLTVDPVLLPHGPMETLAFRFGPFAYATDFKRFPPEAIAAWKGKVKVMVASGLHYRPHHTHSIIPETLALMEELGVERGYLTHLSHQIDYQRDSPALPSHVAFAYDGMEFTVPLD